MIKSLCYHWLSVELWKERVGKLREWDEEQLHRRVNSFILIEVTANNALPIGAGHEQSPPNPVCQIFIRWVMSMSNPSSKHFHVFVHQKPEGVISEAEAVRQLAVGGHKESRESLRSAISPSTNVYMFPSERHCNSCCLGFLFCIFGLKCYFLVYTVYYFDMYSKCIYPVVRLKEVITKISVQETIRMSKLTSCRIMSCCKAKSHNVRWACMY